MKISIFVGDIADAPAEAVCTSTNPRLTLVMGTGAAIRERGGFEILRACEAILGNRGSLPPGSVHATRAGRLPFKVVLHCVASDSTHRSSPEIIRTCVHNALAAAEAHGCSSIAMPVFGAGHARVRFDVSVRTIVDALRERSADLDAMIVVDDRERATEAQALLS